MFSGSNGNYYDGHSTNTLYQAATTPSAHDPGADTWVYEDYQPLPQRLLDPNFEHFRENSQSGYSTLAVIEPSLNLSTSSDGQLQVLQGGNQNLRCLVGPQRPAWCIHVIFSSQPNAGTFCQYGPKIVIPSQRSTAGPPYEYAGPWLQWDAHNSIIHAYSITISGGNPTYNLIDGGAGYAWTPAGKLRLSLVGCQNTLSFFACNNATGDPTIDDPRSQYLGNALITGSGTTPWDFRQVSFLQGLQYAVECSCNGAITLPIFDFRAGALGDFGVREVRAVTALDHSAVQKDGKMLVIADSCGPDSAESSAVEQLSGVSSTVYEMPIDQRAQRLRALGKFSYQRTSPSLSYKRTMGDQNCKLFWHPPLNKFLFIVDPFDTDFSGTARPRYSWLDYEQLFSEQIFDLDLFTTVPIAAGSDDGNDVYDSCPVLIGGTLYWPCAEVAVNFGSLSFPAMYKTTLNGTTINPLTLVGRDSATTGWEGAAILPSGGKHYVTYCLRTNVTNYCKYYDVEDPTFTSKGFLPLPNPTQYGNSSDPFPPNWTCVSKYRVQPDGSGKTTLRLMSFNNAAWHTSSKGTQGGLVFVRSTTTLNWLEKSIYSLNLR